MTAKRLALVIPTYRRPETVARILGEMVEVAYALDVDLYYSDDTPDDSIGSVIRGFSERYPNVFYRRNSPSLGHDRNIIESLLWPESDFVWLIGDSLRPKLSHLSIVVDFLKDQDFVFLNRLVEHGTSIDHVEHGGERDFVREKLWNQTLTGATIYGRRVRRFLRQHEFHIMRNFPHLSVILEFISNQPSSIGWIAQDVLDYSQKPRSYWEDHALDVFVDDWVRAVEAYPQIIPEDRLVSTLRSHSINTNIFSYKRLVSLRSTGRFDSLSIDRPGFWHVMHLNPVIIRLIANMPRFLAGYVLHLDRLRNRQL